MNTAYWISTPQWTCLAEVNEAGTIARCAPYIQRWAYGKPWAQIYASLQQRYQSTLRLVVLSETTC